MAVHSYSHSYVYDAITVVPALLNPDLVASWERIVVPDEVKESLLNYALLSIELKAAEGIDPVALPLHGLLLLTGPPGVGKTTLARGLASAVAVELDGRYGPVRLVDVNAHILPSELLGRTQRNVVQLFQEELPALAEEGPIVVVLDEVEVLAVPRSNASMEINPADVFRGTAALLSALDWVARYLPRTVIVGTTNLPDMVDEALMSRTDRHLNLPLPSTTVLRQILADTLDGLGGRYPACAALGIDEQLGDVALLLEGIDGRQARKFVAEAIATDRQTVLDPSGLSMDTLLRLAKNRRVA